MSAPSIAVLQIFISEDIARLNHKLRVHTQLIHAVIGVILIIFYPITNLKRNGDTIHSLLRSLSRLTVLCNSFLKLCNKPTLSLSILCSRIYTPTNSVPCAVVKNKYLFSWIQSTVKFTVNFSSVILQCTRTVRFDTTQHTNTALY